MPLLDPARLHRVPALLVACLALASLLAIGLSVAPPAAAHPFGDPQTLTVETEVGEVRLRWKAGGTDDLTALALHLGLLPADRVLLDGAVLHEDGDEDLLAAAPGFTDYLLSRVAVTADDVACTGEVLPVADLAADGAVLSFDCGTLAEVEQVVVEAHLLTDLHPEYRTLATGPDGQRAVYDADEPVHTWALTGAPGSADSTSSAVVQLGSVLGVLVVGGVGGAFYVRRRGRREGVPTR